MSKPLVIGLDFDGTCVTHEYPDIGKDIGAVLVLRKLVEQGHLIVLNTMRSGEELDHAVEWFKINGIPLYGVNRNPTQDSWTSSPKVYANVYIDDAALGTPLIKDSRALRPYVDWRAIERLLYERGILSYAGVAQG